MPAFIFHFDTGAGTLSSSSKIFNSTIRDEIRDAVIAQLEEDGVLNPSNQEIIDYLRDRAIADWKNFVRKFKKRIEPVDVDI